ncbi:MAG: RHS repeat-associated core domain-containing protein, partial [Treponema sp.]|nr:RHS repeat-associated core domain-containing protein [Treponema sp.]
DHLGSVRAVTNQWGSPLYMFDYDVFGTPLQDRPERFRHGFTGKEFDSWTGLYNYGFRDYSATFGRFTTVDPIQDGHNWYAYAVSDPVNWLDPWGLTGQESGEDQKRNAEKVRYYVFRDVQSYEISTDRNAPKNTYLDTAFLYNTETGEKVTFHKVQTVANYPSTDGNNKPVDSCYLDTIKAGRFDLKLYTETNVASGKAGVITNAMTIDGRRVDENGITENGKSPGRGLVHSNTKTDGSGDDYTTPYSKQCFIMPGEDTTRFFETLERWGVEDGESIEGYLFNLKIYRREEKK